MREPPPRPSPDSDPSVPIETFGLRLAQELFWALALIVIVVLVLLVAA